MGSAAHKQIVWRQWRAQLTGARQGSKFKESRWWATECRGMDVMENRWPLLMLLIWLGFQRGWWTSWSETPLMGLRGGQRVAEDAGDGLEALHGEEVPDAESEGEAADEGAAAPAADFEGPLQSETRVGKAAAREALQKKRDKLKSSLYYSAVVLCQPLSCRLYACMCHMARPLVNIFGEEGRALMSPPPLARRSSSETSRMEATGKQSGSSWISQ